jgi:uncharacterized membrane protein YidH (DUF202 family)
MNQKLPENDLDRLEKSPQEDDPSGQGSQGVPKPHMGHPAHWSITEELAGDRNRMASERTLMGWIRTSLAMIGFGFGLAKFFEFLRMYLPQKAEQMSKAPIYVGQFLLCLGTFLILLAAIDHWRRLRLIARGEVYTHSRWSLGLVVALILFTLGFIALLDFFYKLL